MIDITQLNPSTVQVLKQIYSERRETIDYMQRRGSAFEKAIALVIRTVGTETGYSEHQHARVQYLQDLSKLPETWEDEQTGIRG
jgi:uncharacterized coiled-coil DUF342 family protein